MSEAWKTLRAGWDSGAAHGKVLPNNLVWSHLRESLFSGCRAAANHYAPAPSPETGKFLWSNSIPLPSSTNTLAKQKSVFKKYFAWQRDWPHASFGLMNWKKYLPAAVRIQPHPMPEFLPASWPHFSRGCRTEKLQCL